MHRVGCSFSRHCHVAFPTHCYPIHLHFNMAFAGRTAWIVSNILHPTTEIVMVRLSCPELLSEVVYNTDIVSFNNCDWGPRDRKVLSAYSFTVAVVKEYDCPSLSFLTASSHAASFKDPLLAASHQQQL